MLTTEQRSKLEHALAAHKARDGITFRNYFCAEEGNADMEALVALGLMRRGRTINDDRDRYYHATEAGMALVGIKGVSHERWDRLAPAGGSEAPEGEPC